MVELEHLMSFRGGLDPEGIEPITPPQATDVLLLHDFLDNVIPFPEGREPKIRNPHIEGGVLYMDPLLVTHNYDKIDLRGTVTIKTIPTETGVLQLISNTGDGRVRPPKLVEGPVPIRPYIKAVDRDQKDMYYEVNHRRWSRLAQELWDEKPENVTPIPLEPLSQEFDNDPFAS